MSRIGRKSLSKTPHLNRRFAAILVPVSVLLVGLAFVQVRYCVRSSLPETLLVVAQGGRLHIPLPQLADGQAHYYECELASGRRVRWFAARVGQGAYYAALDGCEDCDEGRYRPQGRQMVCLACGKSFNLDELRDNRGGGCRPPSLPRVVEEGNLLIRAADIEKALGKLKP